MGNGSTICGGQNAISAYEIVFRQYGPGSTSSSHSVSTTSLSVGGTSSSFAEQIASTTASNESPPPSTTSPTIASDFPAPTTSGTPNCFDGSEFDGTVNDDYLILCDTELPGSDLDSVPAADIAECIDACNSYVPSGEGVCVAVEFDIVSPSLSRLLAWSTPDISLACRGKPLSSQI